MKLFWGLLLLGGAVAVLLDDSFEAKHREIYDVDVEDDLLAIYGDDYTLFEEPLKRVTRPERYELERTTRPFSTPSEPSLTTVEPVTVLVTSTAVPTTEAASTAAPTTVALVTSEAPSTITPSTEAPTTQFVEISTAEPTTTSTSLPLTTSTEPEVTTTLPSEKTTVQPTTTEAPKPTVKPDMTKEEVAQAIENVLDIVDKYVFKDDPKKPYYDEFENLVPFINPVLQKPLRFEIGEPQKEARPSSFRQRGILPLF